MKTMEVPIEEVQSPGTLENSLKPWTIAGSNLGQPRPMRGTKGHHFLCLPPLVSH